MKCIPSHLSGSLFLPESKSLWQRELIAAFFSGQTLLPTSPCDDVAATAAALQAFKEPFPHIDCHESGATLRFLLPLAAAMGKVGAEFRCAPSLLRRPLPLPFPVESISAGYRVSVPLQSGTYAVDASATSQVVSGLLMALPLLPGDSNIMLTNGVVSPGYVTMTLTVLRRHGITVEPRPDGYHIPGGQTYQPAPPLREGDWSAGSWYTLFCPDVTLQNAATPSCQPDSSVLHYVNYLPDEIDISSAPDLFPALALRAALQPRKITHFVHGGYLRGKESDRLEAVQAGLSALGGDTHITADGLVVNGVERLQGGSVFTGGDHRIAMLGVFSSIFCENPVFIDNIGCISKSYPQFLSDYRHLGGKVEE